MQLYDYYLNLDRRLTVGEVRDLAVGAIHSLRDDELRRLPPWEWANLAGNYVASCLWAHTVDEAEEEKVRALAETTALQEIEALIGGDE